MKPSISKVLAACCAGFLALQNMTLFPQMISEAVSLTGTTYYADDDPEQFKYLNRSESSLSCASGSGVLSGSSSTTDDRDAITHDTRFSEGYTLLHGIDVSKYQQNVDWEAVAADGIDYVIPRIGFRGYGAAGNLAMDPFYESHMEGALAAGMDVGVYFFTQAITVEEAVEEAEFVLANLQDYPITMPIYIDIETIDFASGRMDNANLTNEERTAICDAFCSTIEAAGYRTGIYANKYWLTSLLDAEYLSSKYEIWLAHFTTETDYSGEYASWQYTETGTVSGISGYVDRDVYYLPDAFSFAESEIFIYDLTPVTPEFTGSGDVIFTSSAPEIASVTADGCIIPISAGTATITAESEDGRQAELLVTISLRIALDNTSICFSQIGETLQLNTLYTDSENLIWSTSDPEVAVVSKTGLVTSVGLGTAQIIVTDQDGYSAICTVALLGSGIQVGDCNLDGDVNAMDATEILVYAAKLAVGTADALPDAMKSIYDADGSGIIDAMDATKVLIDSAEAGAGL